LNKDGTIAQLRVRWALKEQIVGDEPVGVAEKPQTHTEYVYEEREITLKIPKPALAAETITQKITAERYAVSDAHLVVARDHLPLKIFVNARQPIEYAALKVPQNEWIATDVEAAAEG